MDARVCPVLDVVELEVDGVPEVPWLICVPFPCCVREVGEDAGSGRPSRERLPPRAGRPVDSVADRGTVPAVHP